MPWKSTNFCFFFFEFEFEFEFEFDGKDARITSKRIENIIIIDTCKND